MTLLRNKEIQSFLLVATILLMCATIFGILSFGGQAGLLVLALGLSLTGLFLCYTKRRMARMQSLTKEVDQVLFQEAYAPISAYEEGELSILRTQIHKMNQKLLEKEKALVEERNTLVRSLQDISHQVRTPLTAIHLITDLLKGELDVEKRRWLLKDQENLLRQMDWLIESLLKMAKLDAGTARLDNKKVLVETLYNEAVMPLRIPLELRGQEVVTHIDPLASFQGDLSWSAEALRNLLKNAMDHMEDGKSMYLTAKENALYTELILEDEGPGIDKEDLPHLFTRFYKGKNAKDHSVGIGLSLCKMILLKQNASITAKNKPGGGARFVLRYYKDHT